jgi:type IV pilus assembly protein PilB
MCNHTGYSGRTAIHEIVLIDRQVKRMISEEKSLDDIKAYVKKTQNYKSLFEAAQDLVEEGVTTMAELKRISYYEE